MKELVSMLDQGRMGLDGKLQDEQLAVHRRMKQLAFMLTASLSFLLGVCGVVEGTRDSDGTKLALVMALIFSICWGFVWRQRARNAQEDLWVMVTKGGLYIQEGDKLVRKPLPPDFPALVFKGDEAQDSDDGQDVGTDESSKDEGKGSHAPN